MTKSKQYKNTTGPRLTKKKAAEIAKENPAIAEAAKAAKRVQGGAELVHEMITKLLRFTEDPETAVEEWNQRKQEAVRMQMERATKLWDFNIYLGYNRSTLNNYSQTDDVFRYLQGISAMDRTKDAKASDHVIGWGVVKDSIESEPIFQMNLDDIKKGRYENEGVYYIPNSNTILFFNKRNQLVVANARDYEQYIRFVKDNLDYKKKQGL